jgi:hypothetical protein
MSVSTEVQRTLVKSPPELWSELSNPEALARHLAALGEVRITAVEPETRVEWETDGASGIVHLKQSGWGTKVTLSVTRAAPAAEEPPSEPEVIAEPAAETGLEAVATAETEPKPEPVATAETEPEPEPEPVATAETEPELEPVAAAEPESVPEPVTEPAAGAEAEPEPGLEPVSAAEPEPVTELEPTAAAETEAVTEPAPRPGFFARLFRRRKVRSNEAFEANLEPGASPKSGAIPASEAGPAPERGPEIEVVALAAPEPLYPQRPATPEPEVVEPADDLAAELGLMEAQMTSETTELLTDVLDRLGAAHHRPFSRG